LIDFELFDCWLECACKIFSKENVPERREKLEELIAVGKLIKEKLEWTPDI
jgi:hypothetical protein